MRSFDMAKKFDTPDNVIQVSRNKNYVDNCTWLHF